MRQNRLLQAIREGKPAFGPELWSGSAAILEVMGQSPFQWVGIDVEHTPYTSYETVTNLCRAAEAANLTPIASVGECNPLLITKLLEVGVMGVIVAHTITQDDALKAVNAAKYPPLGHRGAAPAVRQQNYALDVSRWPEMADRANREVAVIGKVEDVEALDNLDAILSTPIDGLMVGAFDLSHSIGIPQARGRVRHPKIAEARDRIFAKCQEHGKFGVAVLSQLMEEGQTPAQVVEKWAPRGVLVYALTYDLAMVGDWCRRMASSLKLE